MAGGEHQVLNAVQDEASSAALRLSTLVAQNFLLAKREGLLRRHLLETYDAGNVHSSDGRAEAAQLLLSLPQAPRT